MHPGGQLPAYEWAFGDVNPPVHAWAALRVFENDGSRDFDSKMSSGRSTLGIIALVRTAKSTRDGGSGNAFSRRTCNRPSTSTLTDEVLPVRQTGLHVVQRLVVQLLLDQAQIGDVIDHRHDALGHLLVVEQHRGVQVDHRGLTIGKAQRKPDPEPRIPTGRQTAVALRLQPGIGPRIE